MRMQVSGLKKYFGQVKAVDDISFGIEAGEIYGFVGPNGAGKTTTLRVLATLDDPTGGDVTLDGVSIVEHPEAARRAIGFMPDSLPTHLDITVRDYLDFFARAYGLANDRRRQVIDGVEEFTRLDGLREKPIHALSKGLKQRVSLGRALIHDPAILLLDEPAAALDPRARVELRELLLLLAEQGKAILISSHILSELSEICHGAVILEHGRIVKAGRIDALLHAEEAHITLRIRSLEDQGSFHRALLEAPLVETVRPVGKELEVDVLGDEEAASRLLAYLVTSGHRVAEFRRHRSGLEEVFMTVTRGEVH